MIDTDASFQFQNTADNFESSVIDNPGMSVAGVSVIDENVSDGCSLDTGKYNLTVQSNIGWRVIGIDNGD